MKKKRTLVKILLVPFYAMYLYVIIYIFGDARDVWDKVSAWVDKKYK